MVAEGKTQSFIVQPVCVFLFSFDVICVRVSVSVFGLLQPLQIALLLGAHCQRNHDRVRIAVYLL